MKHQMLRLKPYEADINNSTNVKLLCALIEDASRGCREYLHNAYYVTAGAHSSGHIENLLTCGKVNPYLPFATKVQLVESAWVMPVAYCYRHQKLCPIVPGDIDMLTMQ
jgi:hypothetical protein